MVDATNQDGGSATGVEQAPIELQNIAPYGSENDAALALDSLNLEESPDYQPLMDMSHTKKEPERKKAPVKEVEETEAEDTDTEEVEEEVDNTDPNFDPSQYVFEVNVAGEKQEVTLDELTNGYQRNGDYTKKTQALAAEKKQIEENIQQIQQERAQYTQYLSQFGQMMGSQRDAQIKAIEPLKEEDPALYLIKKSEIDESANLQVQAEQERIRVQQQMDQDQQRLTQSFIQRENEALVDKMPELRNKDKKTQLLTDLKTYGLTQGYTDEELSTTVDHRAILVLDKARKYDEMKKQSPNIKRLKKVPKVLKPGAKQAPERSVPSKKRTQLKMRQLKNSGSVEDAASIFFDQLQSGAIK